MNLSDQVLEITRRIVQISNPDKIILFGSHTRDEANPNSDVDMLMIVPGVRGWRR